MPGRSVSAGPWDRVSSLADFRQVIVDQECEAQLVGAAVDAASLGRVLLQLAKVNQKCVLRRDDALPQVVQLGVCALTRRVQAVNRLDQVRRRTQLGQLVGQRQITHMK